MPDGWNPRYLAYARATGAHDPETVFARDGSNAQFMSWIAERWREWRKERGRADLYGISKAEHADFDAWLAGRVSEVVPS